MSKGTLNQCECNQLLRLNLVMTSVFIRYPLQQKDTYPGNYGNSAYFLVDLAPATTIFPIKLLYYDLRETLNSYHHSFLFIPMLTTAVSLSRPVLQRDQVLAWLKDHVPEPRLQHILRVEEMSQALATHHHLDPEKAAQAGLLHDLAKYFPSDKLLSIAQAWNLEITEVDQADPHLLHADVSACVAQSEFGVTDPEILAAVADHTLGRPGMGLLSCVVFLADSLEPGRGDSKDLNQLRKIAQENLYAAVWQTCDRTLEHLIKHHRLIHPRMIATRNWAIQLAPPGRDKSKS